MLWLVYICYNVPYWKTKHRKTEEEREREETENKEFPNNVLFWKRWWQIERTKRSFFKVNLINRTQNNNIYCNIYIYQCIIEYLVCSKWVPIWLKFHFSSSSSQTLARCFALKICLINSDTNEFFPTFYIYWSYIYNIYILILLFIIFQCNDNVNNFFPFRKLTKQLSVSFIDEKKIILYTYRIRILFLFVLIMDMTGTHFSGSTSYFYSSSA